MGQPEFVAAMRRAGVDLVVPGKRHARELGRVMRPEDGRETWASDRALPEAAVRASLNRSNEAWAVYAGGDILCVFGVMVLPNGKAAPWALTSTHVRRHTQAFWRASKVAVEYLRDRYPKMTQMVHARYLGALRWVERLGFKVGQPEKFGKAGDWFCPIELETKCVLLSR